MKIIILLLLLPSFSIGQKIVDDKTDDFTKAKIKRTSWETICGKGSFYTYAKGAKIDDTRYLTLRIMGNHNHFTVRDSDVLMIKMQSDTIIELRIYEPAYSCRGCGAISIVGSAAEGIEVRFKLIESVYEYLINNKIAKMRLYTSDGYMEGELKEKHAEMLIKVLELIK